MHRYYVIDIFKEVTFELLSDLLKAPSLTCSE